MTGSLIERMRVESLAVSIAAAHTHLAQAMDMLTELRKEEGANPHVAAHDKRIALQRRAISLMAGSHGGFAMSIGDAYLKADSKNAARLVMSFPELFGDI